MPSNRLPHVIRALGEAANSLNDGFVSARDLGRRPVKKFYIAIPFDDSSHNQKKIKDLGRGVLDGVQGISEKSEIIMQWYGLSRDAILIMDADKLTQINKLSRVQYDNPEYLVSNGMSALYRIFDKKRDAGGQYGIAGNLIDYMMVGTKPSKNSGSDVLDGAKKLADQIEKDADAVRAALEALPFDQDDLNGAVRSVTDYQVDADDIKSVLKHRAVGAVQSLRSIAGYPDGLAEKTLLYFSGPEMSLSSAYITAAALASQAEANALDYGWAATQVAALVNLMRAYASLVKDFEEIPNLEKAARDEIKSMPGDARMYHALDRGMRAILKKDFSDHGTDDIQTVKGLVKRLHDVFSKSGHWESKGIPLSSFDRAIRKALKSIGNIYTSEGEWLVKDKKLKVPMGSILYVTSSILPEDVEQRRLDGTLTRLDRATHRLEIDQADEYDRIIEENNLDRRYKVLRIDPIKFNRAREKWQLKPRRSSAALQGAAEAVAAAFAVLEAAAFNPDKPLKATDTLTVYHGANLGQIPHLINGFDATVVAKRYYNGPKHRGIFVAPTAEWARKFGEVVLELEVRAKNLHGTDYSGGTGRQNPDREATWKDQHPESFRPYLSQTLSQGTEPQALLIGLVSPRMIKRVLYKGQWYSRQKFLDLKLKTMLAPKPGRSGGEQEVADLGVDVSFPNYRFDQFVKAVAKIVDVDEERALSTLIERAAIPLTPSRDALLDILERLFEPTAAKAYAKRFRSKLQSMKDTQ